VRGAVSLESSEQRSILPSRRQLLIGAAVARAGKHQWRGPDPSRDCRCAA